MNRFVYAMLFAAGCAASPGSGGPSDNEPLALDVTSPARGAIVDGSAVTVSGTTNGDSVTIDGTAVTVAADGSFSATVSVQGGVALVETHALGGGSDVRDVRAVLAGPLAMADGSEQTTIAALASPAALSTIADAIGSDAEAIDFTAAAKALNPIYDNGGCLGATVNVTSVSLGAIHAAITPKANALATDVTIDNVKVKLSASYKVACIGGSDTITVTAASAKISGNLGAKVASGKIATSLPSATVTLNGFSLDVGGIPSEVVDLFQSQVKSAVQNALANAIVDHVPSLANQELAGLVAKGATATVLGKSTTLAVTPDAVSLSAHGLYIALDATALVDGGSAGAYFTAPATASAALLSGSTGLGVAVECDLANSLLAGLWSAGALDATVQTSALSGASAFLDPNATQVALSLALPPTLTASGSGALQLALGDATVTVEDASGNALQAFALSVQTGVSAGPQNGAIALSLGTPTLYATVLQQASDGSAPLGDAEIEALLGAAWGVLAAEANTALDRIPLPSLGGVQAGAPTVTGAPGFLVADVPVD